jgi:hypothetical protein
MHAETHFGLVRKKQPGKVCCRIARKEESAPGLIGGGLAWPEDLALRFHSDDAKRDVPLNKDNTGFQLSCGGILRACA